MGWSNVLCVPPPAEVGLDPDEVLRRIAPAFRRVRIDRIAADRWIDARCQQLAEISCPTILIEGERQLKGRVAHVAISNDESEGSWVCFYLRPEGLIVVDFESEEHGRRCQPTIQKLTGLLGYVVDELAQDPAPRWTGVGQEGC